MRILQPLSHILFLITWQAYYQRKTGGLWFTMVTLPQKKRCRKNDLKLNFYFVDFSKRQASFIVNLRVKQFSKVSLNCIMEVLLPIFPCVATDSVWHTRKHMHAYLRGGNEKEVADYIAQPHGKVNKWSKSKPPSRKRAFQGNNDLNYNSQKAKILIWWRRFSNCNYQLQLSTVSFCWRTSAPSGAKVHHIPVCSGLSQWQASKQAFLLKWRAFEIYGRAFEI